MLRRTPLVAPSFSRMVTCFCAHTAAAATAVPFVSRAFCSTTTAAEQPHHNLATDAAGTIPLSSANFSDRVSEILSAKGQTAIYDHKLKRIHKLRSELDTLTTRKAALDAKCQSAPDNYARLALLYLVGQSTLLYYWVYMRFDWCLCEPITYLLGTAVGWISLGFYLLTGGDYDWDNLRGLMIERAQKKAYVADKLDIVLIHDLESEIKMLEKELDDVDHTGV